MLENLEDTRLSEEETHEEANMMKGKMYEELRETAPEEYDKVLQAIEDLKNLAEKEPNSSKVLYAFGRTLHNIGRIPGAAAWFMANIFDTAYKVATDKMGTGDYPFSGGLEDLDDWLKDRLTNASKKLAEMKKAGEKFGKNELAS